ncbi:MAG: primosomal replication protein PriC, partial [Serratia inhibens]|uniref:primosomal replication protein PriC n=1 Tax=Serratia inhibens TaxID=2338073 RepID=UPI003C7ED090
LMSMIQDRESLLGKQTTFAAQQKLQHELSALEGRLVRCRQALARIERSIERKENGF